MGFLAGFTLIEMLVVFSLLFTFSTVGIASYVQFTNNQSLDASVGEFSTMLNTARVRAVSQVIPEAATSCAGQTLQGYQISLMPWGKDYEIDILCGGNVVALNKQKLSNNICFNSSSNTPVIFNVTDGTTKPSTITINGVGKSKVIGIDNAGNVSVSEVAASSGCPVAPQPTLTPVPTTAPTLIPRNTPVSTPTPTNTPISTVMPSGAIVSGQVYKLVNQCGNKVMDVQGVSMADGANVLQWSWNGGENQQWRVESVSAGYYKLTAKHSGKVLDVKGISTVDGANVDQWSWNGGANQQWRITDIGGGFYKLYAKHSGKALDVNGASSQDGANVQQWASNNTCAQKWQIIKI
jgi:Tfp pilus assembly protein FimT